MENKMDVIQGTFAQIVKQVRGRALLSQESFAAAIGVCPATLIRWEKGDRQPSFLSKQMFEAYCKKNKIIIKETDENAKEKEI